MAKKINRKKQLVNISTLLIVVVLLVLLLVGTLSRIRLWFKGYSFPQQNIILKLEDEQVDAILSLDHVVDLEYWNQMENDRNYIDYENYANTHQTSLEDTIHYIDALYELMPKLEPLGYTKQDCLLLSDRLQIKDFEFLLETNCTLEKVQKYINIKGFIVEDLEAYLESDKKPLDAVLSISYPIIDASKTMDREYEIMDPKNNLALIKKGFFVDSGYAPKDLREVDLKPTSEGVSCRLRDEAATALEKMAKDAKKEGYELMINSSYRSYDDQNAIYNEYFSIYDEVTAASLVSKPGSSEHQLGLSVDLSSQSVVDGTYNVFGDSPDYQWVIKHAHEYGFILRYPSEKTELTGAANEPWHFRYVGKKAAKEMYEKDWVLEEYIYKHGFDYDMILKQD